MSNKYQELIQHIEKYAQMADEKTPAVVSKHKDLDKFFWAFTQKLHSIVNEIEGDILTLKLQGFNKHMLQLIMKIHEAIGTILRELNEDNALILADKLIKYVSNNAVLDNLSFLIDKHLEGKKVDFIPHQMLGVAQVNGLKKLKELIGYLKANI